MSIAFLKDLDTKVVAIGAEVVIDKDALHDSFSRFFVPDGKTFRVLFECAGKTLVVASGIAKAKTGKVCPIRVKVRIEPEGDEPQDPALEDKI